MLFGPTQIDFRIVEMLDSQRRQDIEFEGGTAADFSPTKKEETKYDGQDGNRIDTFCNVSQSFTMMASPTNDQHKETIVREQQQMSLPEKIYYDDDARKIK